MRKLRVCLVDDHPIFVDSLQVLLGTRAEYEVVGKAGGCASAIEAVKTCRPDLVRMDLSMADMSGIEATRRSLRRCHGQEWWPSPCTKRRPSWPASSKRAVQPIL